MQPTWDLIVVGAGILGTSHAYHAARRGWRVLLLERGDWPGEASVRNFGTLMAGSLTGEWRRRGMPVQMGWHPNLTMDRPVLPAQRVPSLVRADGRFHELGGLLVRLLTRRIRFAELQAELAAQYARFLDLVGGPPA